MAYWMVWFPLKLLLWGLSIVGAATLVLTAMLATPLARLPELTSVSKAARAVDRSTMPELQRFIARDGTELAYRHYPARGVASEKIAILVHGSSGSSTSVHALADDDPWVLPQLPRELPVTDIDGVNPSNAAIEQHVGKAASRSADIERNHSLDRDSEVVERVGELNAAARHPGVIASLQHENSV